MPPINRTDQPYPLRTIDGQVDVKADNLVVSGDTTLNNLTVTGTTDFQGPIVFADLEADKFIAKDSVEQFGSTTAEVDVYSNNGVVNVKDSGGTLGTLNTGRMAATQAATGKAVTTQENTTDGTNSTAGFTANIGASVIETFVGGSANTTEGNRGIVRTGNTAGLDIDVQGSAKTIKLSTDSIPRITINDSTIEVTNRINSTQRIYSDSITLESTAGQTVTVDSTLDAAAGLGSVYTKGGISADKNIYSGGTVTGSTVTSTSICNGPLGSFTTLQGGSVKALNTTASTSPTTGSLLTDGGLGVVGDANIGGDLTVTGSLGFTKITASSGENATSTITGAVNAPNGGVGCGQDLFVGGIGTFDALSGQTTVNSTTDSGITNQPQAFRVKGGTQIDKTLRLFNGPVLAAGVDSTFGTVVASSTTDQTGSNTGAIHTGGGASIGRSLYVANNIDFGPAGNINIKDINSDPFLYSSGTWVPNLSSLVRNGPDPDTTYVKSAWVSPTITIQQGYYERIGHRVTLWYDVEYVINGPGNSLTDEGRFPCVDNLPFECKTLGGLPVSDGAGFTDESFPNGIEFGVAAPIVATYPYPYDASILAKDSVWQPAIPPLFPDRDGWVSDGKTFFINSIVEQYAAGSLISYSAYGSLFNTNILVTGTDYRLRFSGTLSYFIS